MQREPLVWSGAQEFGADDGLELADLAGEEGVPDAELACCALEAGLPGDRQESPDALPGTRMGEGVPDVRGERAWPAEGGEGVGAAVDAVPDADAVLAGCGGEGLDGDAGLGGDVLEAALTFLVPLAEPVRVDGVVGGAGWRSPALERSCRMVRSLYPVMRAILRGPCPWLARSRSCSVPGGARRVAGHLGAVVTFAVRARGPGLGRQRGHRSLAG